MCDEDAIEADEIIEPGERSQERKNEIIAMAGLIVSGKRPWQIAKDMGITKAEVLAMVDDVHAMWKEEAVGHRERSRNLAAAQLDHLMQLTMEKAEAGDLRAVEVGIRVIDRQSKLLGLDEPPVDDRSPIPMVSIDFEALQANPGALAQIEAAAKQNADALRQAEEKK